MKIEKIIQEEDIFIVTYKPNVLEKLFGVKEKFEKYKATNMSYVNGKDAKVYINQKGEILHFHHKMNKILDNFRRKFD